MWGAGGSGAGDDGYGGSTLTGKAGGEGATITGGWWGGVATMRVSAEAGNAVQKASNANPLVITPV